MAFSDISLSYSKECILIPMLAFLFLHRAHWSKHCLLNLSFQQWMSSTAILDLGDFMSTVSVQPSASCDLNRRWFPCYATETCFTCFYSLSLKTLSLILKLTELCKQNTRTFVLESFKMMSWAFLPTGYNIKTFQHKYVFYINVCEMHQEFGCKAEKNITIILPSPYTLHTWPLDSIPKGILYPKWIWNV